jgi:hypothetical protein
MNGLPPKGLLWLLAVGMVMVSACGNAASLPNQSTLDAQILNSQQLATRIASKVQSTSQSAGQQVTATAQAAYQQVTATAQAVYQQVTATAQEVQASVTEAEYWNAVLSENFDQDNGTWQTGEETNEFGSSKWSIEQGKLVWEASATQGMVWWTIPDMQAVDDFYVSVVVSQNDSPPDSLVGVAFRVTEDEETYYVFQVTPQGEFAVYQLKNDGWITIVPASTSLAYLPGQANQLAVLGEGNNYHFLINEKLVADMHHESLSGGTAGLVIGLNNPNDKGRWEFESFQVKIPPQSPILTPTTP